MGLVAAVVCSPRRRTPARAAVKGEVGRQVVAIAAVLLWRETRLLRLSNENEAYIELLCGHLQRLTRRLRRIPAERWEWQPTIAAPSPRLLAQHAWLWLVSDRLHLLEPDATRHEPPADPPTAQDELCALLDEESCQWRSLLHELTPERLSEPRRAFNWRPVNVRWLVWHMCQNVIYKHGQLATLYFMLGLDGDEPYRAPLPQDDYERLAEMRGHPHIQWVLGNGPPRDGTTEPPNADPDERDRAGCTALHYAAWLGATEKVQALLARGAEINSEYGDGWTALMDAAWLGHEETVRVLLAAGADPTRKDMHGNTALSFAAQEAHQPVVELLARPETAGDQIPYEALPSDRACSTEPQAG